MSRSARSTRASQSARNDNAVASASGTNHNMAFPPSTSSIQLVSSVAPAAKLYPFSSITPERSIFYRVLTAAFAPFVAAAEPPAPKPRTLTEEERLESYAMVDWDRTQHQYDSADESDDEDDASMYDGFEPDTITKPVYEPFGHWAFAARKAIENPQTLMSLGAGAMCSAAIKKGTIANRTILYINRCWSLSQRVKWRGFYSELALYKSERYMRKLQGIVVPFLIGVQIDGISVGLAMELPHHSFWIEASPEMPMCLKERVIQAYSQLHQVGVLHGDAELRHMLIGGDARITLIDFQESRALNPLPEVNLKQADPSEFALEIRRVKYKLDYNGARAYEQAKMNRAYVLRNHNLQRSQKIKAKEMGLYDGPIEPSQLPIQEDVDIPPVDFETWEMCWVRAADDPPRRFVVPGQSPEQVQAAIRDFDGMVLRLEHARIERAQNLRKRKTSSSPDDEGESAADKRRRGYAALTENPWPRTTVFYSEAFTDDDLPKAGRRSVYDFPLPPKVRDFGVKRKHFERSVKKVPRPDVPLAENPYRCESRSFSEAVTDLGDLPVASDSSDPPPPPKVRDFSQVPYRGPRGYYVPHPPTETRMGVERAWFIRTENHRECMERRLPYSEKGMDYMYPPDFKRPVPKGQHISKGALKRKVAEMEHPELVERPAWKRKRRRTIPLPEDCEWEFVEADQHIDICANQRILDTSEIPRRNARRALTYARKRVPSGPPRLRGILRHKNQSRPKSLSNRHEDWANEDDVCHSPKIGPMPLPVPVSETRAILGAYHSEMIPSARPVYQDEDDEETSTTAPVSEGGHDSSPPLDDRDEIMTSLAMGMFTSDSQTMPSSSANEPRRHSRSKTRRTVLPRKIVERRHQREQTSAKGDSYSDVPSTGAATYRAVSRIITRPAAPSIGLFQYLLNWWRR